MCATFELSVDRDSDEECELLEKLVARYGEGVAEKLKGDFFPKMDAPVLGPNGGAALLRWGFPLEGSKRVIFNARAESLRTKPMFREYANNRCLVPANSFYEWDRQKKKHRLRFRGEKLFYMAGLWRPAEGPDGKKQYCFVIITTPPNEAVAALHDRMPAVIAGGDRGKWLSVREAEGLLRPFEQPMEITGV